MKTLHDQTIIELDSRTHVLTRPTMYVGSIDEKTETQLVLEDKKFIKKEINFVPGLLKIINEIIDNSVDEAIRTNYKFANKIKISIEDNQVEVEDNGRGIPVKLSPGTNHYMPVIAFCNVNAGSNFSDDNRTSIGMNGIGSKTTNIFSTYFKVETSDGKNRLVLVCKDNLKTNDFTIHKDSRQFTKIRFKPDLKRFKVNSLNENYIMLIKQRLLFLSMSHPQIKFYFNKERININNEKNFMNLFSESFELFSDENWFIGIYPNEEDDFNFFTYVNGLFIKNGGNHISFISNEIVSRLRDKLIKKFKSIKPGDIRNKLSLVVFFKNFPNMKFDSQTKETLTNSITEIRDYLNIDSVGFDNIGKKILKNTEIIDPIVDMFKLKEEFKKRNELKKISNNKKKVNSDKYYPPTKNKKYLILAEGDSASGSLMSILGRQDFGFFALRGKPLNTYDVKTLKLAANKEIQTIVDVLNLDLTDLDTDMEYEYVVFGSDQDADGFHIRSLLLTFFERFTPKLLKEGRIVSMNTPLVVAKKKNEIKHWFFDFNSYKDFSSTEKLDWKYYKGLGSWKKEDFISIIEKIKGFENLLSAFEVTKNSHNQLKIWMKSSEVDERKNKLFNKSFNISTL